MIGLRIFIIFVVILNRDFSHFSRKKYMMRDISFNLFNKYESFIPFLNLGFKIYTYGFYIDLYLF